MNHLGRRWWNVNTAQRWSLTGRQRRCRPRCRCCWNANPRSRRVNRLHLQVGQQLYVVNSAHVERIGEDVAADRHHIAKKVDVGNAVKVGDVVNLAVSLKSDAAFVNAVE